MGAWLVTGANRGIGLGIVTQLAARGEAVVAACRDPAGAPALSGLAAAHPGKVTVQALDVTSDASVAAAARAVTAPLSVLINNAGVYGPRSGQGALDMDFDAWAAVLAVNAIAPLRVSQAFLPHLEKGRGKILTVSSRMGSLQGDSGGAIAYRSSKAAVNKAMLGLAEALKPRGIPVIVLHPGWVRTDMGGAGADISVEQSAAGIVALADGLTLAGTGQFRNYDGATIPW